MQFLSNTIIFFALFLCSCSVLAKNLDLTYTDKVFFDITHGGRNMGRITFGLFGNVVPKTVKNFVTLSESKEKDSNGKIIGYKGSPFHRIIANFMIQGGDFTNRNGTGGKSIYGEKFNDENFDIPHTKSGQLSMANSGPNTNGSQFFITSTSTTWLNGRHTVFGEIIEGRQILHNISKVETNIGNDSPLEEVLIADCGILRENHDL